MVKIAPPRSKKLSLYAFASMMLIASSALFFKDMSGRAVAQNGGATLSAPVSTRPAYDLSLQIDAELLTLRGAATIVVAASPRDPLSDAVFFVYANASGVGGADTKRKNIVVDSVSMGGKAIPFTLVGAVLKVRAPAPQTAPFAIQVKYHGVVPRAPEQSGGALGGLLGSDIDLGALLGTSSPVTGDKPKAKNTDYGLYTFGNEILSLGSFWYPALAVRQNGKWADDAPEGLGDVAFSEKSDFQVQIQAPANMTVVAPGKVSRSSNGARTNASGANVTTVINARNVRECAVLMSDDFISKSSVVDVGGKPVRVSAYCTKKSAPKLETTLQVAAKALQIYARRFGPYAYDDFKVVEAPMRSGAGGMEYSGVVGIASMLYADMGKEIGNIMTTLDLPGASALLGDLGLEDGTGTAPLPAGPQAKDDGTGTGGFLDGILGQQGEILDSLLETTVAHEVAHQWWAIGVGSDSQKHPFVDEALTNWSAMLYFEDRYGREKAEQMIDLHLKTTFSMGAMLGGDRPANLPTAAYGGNLQYGAVIYGKAAFFYVKLRELVGDEVFFGALKTYYARYANKIAAPNDLKAIFIARAPTKKAQISALYTRWIDEAHGREDIGSGLGALGGGMDISGLLGDLLGGMGNLNGGLGGDN